MGKKARSVNKTTLQFNKFQIIWGKLTGYPWWPGRIIGIFTVDESKIPNGDISKIKSISKIEIKQAYTSKQKQKAQKYSNQSKKEKTIYKVEFIKENTYAYLDHKTIQSYYENWEKHAHPNKCPHSKLFQQARAIADDIMSIEGSEEEHNSEEMLPELGKSSRNQNMNIIEKENRISKKATKEEKRKTNRSEGNVNGSDASKEQNEINLKYRKQLKREVLVTTRLRTLRNHNYKKEAIKIDQTPSKHYSFLKNKVKPIRKIYQRNEQNKLTAAERRAEQLQYEQILLRKYNFHLITGLNPIRKKWRKKQNQNLQTKNPYQESLEKKQMIKANFITKIFKIIKSKSESTHSAEPSHTIKGIALIFGTHLFRVASNSIEAPYKIFHQFLKWVQQAQLPQIIEKSKQISEAQIKLERQQRQDEIGSKNTQNLDGLRKQTPPPIIHQP